MKKASPRPRLKLRSSLRSWVCGGSGGEKVFNNIFLMKHIWGQLNLRSEGEKNLCFIQHSEFCRIAMITSVSTPKSMIWYHYQITEFRPHLGEEVTIFAKGTGFLHTSDGPLSDSTPCNIASCMPLFWR